MSDVARHIGLHSFSLKQSSYPRSPQHKSTSTSHLSQLHVQLYFQEILFRHGNPRSASSVESSSTWNGVTSTFRSQLAGTRCRAMTSPSHPATTLLARPQHSNVSMMSARLFDCPFWPTQTTTARSLQARVQFTAVHKSSLQAKPAMLAFRFHASSSSFCLAYDNARVCQK